MRSRALTRRVPLAPKTLHIEANTDAGDDGDDELDYEDAFSVDDLLVLDRMEREAGLQGE